MEKLILMLKDGINWIFSTKVGYILIFFVTMHVITVVVWIWYPVSYITVITIGVLMVLISLFDDKRKKMPWY